PCDPPYAPRGGARDTRRRQGDGKAFRVAPRPRWLRGRVGDCVRAYDLVKRSTRVLVLVPGRRALRLTCPVCLVPGFSNGLPVAQRGSERGLENCPGELQGREFAGPERTRGWSFASPQVY